MNKKEFIQTIAFSLFGMLFTFFAIVVFGSCASSNDAADNYIQELERTLEINNIDINDTVGGSDAYAEYYNL